MDELSSPSASTGLWRLVCCLANQCVCRHVVLRWVDGGVGFCLSWWICATVDRCARYVACVFIYCLRRRLWRFDLSNIDPSVVLRIPLSVARTTYEVTHAQRSGHQRTVCVSSPFCVRSNFAATTRVFTTGLRLVQHVALVPFLVPVRPCPDRLRKHTDYQGSLTEKARPSPLSPVCVRCSESIFRNNGYCLDSVPLHNPHLTCYRHCVRPQRPSVLQWLSTVRIGYFT